MMVDTRGLECPEPKRRTIKAIEQNKGRDLTVLGDNPASLDDISVMLRVMGIKFIVEQSGAEWKIQIQRQTSNC